MDIEKIEKFIDAGYTKEDIEKMLQGGNNDGGKPEGLQDKDKKPNEGGKLEEPKESGAGNSTHDSTIETIKALTETVNSLKDTVKAMQDNNANNADSGHKPKDEIEDVMKSFIDSL
jgi:hypothetical protein